MKGLIVVLGVIFAAPAALSSSRDFVIYIEETQNTKEAIQATQEGIARLFSYFGGMSTKFLFHVYRANHESTLEKLGTPSRDGDTVVSILHDMIAHPMESSEPCDKACCVSKALFDHFPSILDAHLGGVFFVLIDSISYSSEQQRTRIYHTLEQSHSLLYLVRTSQSYCNSNEDDIYGIALSQNTYILENTKIADLVASLTSHHNSIALTATSLGSCRNESIYMAMNGLHQGVVFTVVKTKLNKPVIVADPNGSNWSATTTINLNDPGSSQIISIHAGCDPNWQYSNGLCLLRKSLPSTWTRAREDCAAYNATLLRTTDAVTTERILRQESLWYGDDSEKAAAEGLAIDVQSSWLDLDDHDAQKQFRYRFSNGKSLALNLTGYQPWAAGEPLAQLLGRRCVRLLRASGRWITTLCSAMAGYTCQKPAISYNDEPKRFLPAGRWTFSLDSYVGCIGLAYQME